MPDQIRVVFRRLPVEPDRSPHGVQPGDYVAVLLDEHANEGELPVLAAVTLCGEGWVLDSIPLSLYRRSRRVKNLDQVPQNLLDKLRFNPDNPDQDDEILIRHRIQHRDLAAIWS